MSVAETRIRAHSRSRTLAALRVPMIVAGIAGACGGARSEIEPVTPDPTPIVVPAGVDSSVAAYADSVADASFVEVDRQEQAAALQTAAQLMVERSDSLWRELDTFTETARVVSAEDSVRAAEVAVNGGLALVALDSVLRDSVLDAAELRLKTEALLDSAETALEAAHDLNPFDTRSRLWLSRAYELQARRLGQSEAYGRAIEELEKLARLTPDQHSVFAMLANNHFRLERWSDAADNYARARAVYLNTHDLVTDGDGALDSGLVFDYLRAEAEMHVRLLDAPSAAAALGALMAYATKAGDSTYVVGELEWMAWDNMNIASRVARDSLGTLEETGDLKGAYAGYADLLPRLSHPRAIDETHWRLAIVDYNLGRGDAAVERLRQLVARTETDSVGVPLDATYVRYVDDYGALCLNLGRDYLHDQRDNRTALKYFAQATRIVWASRSVAYLETATLLQSNAMAALENANRALEGDAELTVDQRRALYRLLMGLHRRTGAFDEARKYRDAYLSLESR